MKRAYSSLAALGLRVLCSSVALLVLIAGLVGLPSLAFAQSSVTMNANTGPVGTMVTAEGMGFTPDESDSLAKMTIVGDGRPLVFLRFDSASVSLKLLRTMNSGGFKTASEEELAIALD